MAKSWSPVLLQVLLIAILVAAASGENEKKSPPVFILGDSTADIGTNSYLPASRFRADFPHNGIDFPGSRSTGRFSNGLNSADFLAKYLGLGFKRSPPPFLSLNTSSALLKYSFHGINFASGGSGLLDATGESALTPNDAGMPVSTPPFPRLQNVVTMSEQIQQFSKVRGNIKGMFGEEGASKLLAKSLFFISSGSNDIFAYAQSKTKVFPAEFIRNLGCAYETHLKNLYKLGARKFGIISIPPIGCCPALRVSNATGGCMDGLNELALAFHSELTAILTKLSSQSEHEGLLYSLGNAYDMTMDVILNPAPFKFKDVKGACCGAGILNAEAECDPKAKLCSMRHQYLFWDKFHPTTAASKLAAMTLFSGGPRYVSPINFAQLARA